MKTIYFVRHGETTANVERVLAGSRTNTPLTAKGIEQAVVTAEALRPVAYDLLISSPLVRARDTAQIIAEIHAYQGPIVESDLLLERDFGKATSKPYEEIGDAVETGNVEGLESLEDFALRAQASIRWLNEQDAEVMVVVSHGGFGQMFGTVLEGKNPQNFREYHHLDNAEYYVLTIGAKA